MTAFLDNIDVWIIVPGVWIGLLLLSHFYIGIWREGLKNFFWKTFNLEILDLCGSILRFCKIKFVQIMIHGDSLGPQRGGRTKNKSLKVLNNNSARKAGTCMELSSCCPDLSIIKPLIKPWLFEGRLEPQMWKILHRII